MLLAIVGSLYSQIKILLIFLTCHSYLLAASYIHYKSIIDEHNILYRETDISLFLCSISPLLAGKLEHLRFNYVFINSACVRALVYSLKSRISSLHELQLHKCAISSSDYLHLIGISKLTNFASYRSLTIDVSVAKELAKLLESNKTLEKVEVLEKSLNRELTIILARAMRVSNVKKLQIGHVDRTGCNKPIELELLGQYPLSKVELL